MNQKKVITPPYGDVEFKLGVDMYAGKLRGVTLQGEELLAKYANFVLP